MPKTHVLLLYAPKALASIAWASKADRLNALIKTGTAITEYSLKREKIDFFLKAFELRSL